MKNLKRGKSFYKKIDQRHKYAKGRKQEMEIEKGIGEKGFEGGGKNWEDTT